MVRKSFVVAKHLRIDIEAKEVDEARTEPQVAARSVARA